MSPRKPQLTIDEVHQLKWLLGGALAIFSVWTVFYLELDIWFLLFADTIAIVACMAWPRLPSHVPKWMHQAAFPVIVAVFLVDLWLTAQILPSMVRLALLLILYRGVSYRLRRDDLQLVVLGLFLVILTGVITVSLLFTVQIAFFTACALGFLFAINLVDSAEARDPPPKTPFFTWKLAVATPTWIHQASWPHLFRRIRQTANWKVLALGAALFAGVVGSSAVLFISIPRFQLENSLFLDQFMAKKSRVGFTDNIRFGDVTDIIADNNLALSIQIEDPATMPARLYLRMVVLDEYNDKGFRLSAAGSKEGFGGETSVSQVRGTARPELNQVSWTFFYEAGVSNYLPLPGSFDIVRFSERQNLRASERYRLIMLRNEPLSMKPYLVLNPDTAPLLRDLKYVEILAADSAAGIIRPESKLPLGAADRELLQAAVAEITRGEALTAEEFARRACGWLQARHAYSVQSALPPGGNDPLVRWLGSGQPGHCEFFAGSFALLARAAGFPARLVTGFVGGGWNPYSRSLTIRNTNAHAWCEIWDGKDSWLRVDATPGSGGVTTQNEFASASLLAARTDSSWKARLESLRIFWYLRIVNFDEREQIATIGRIASAMGRLRERANKLADSARESLRQIWDPRRLAVFVGALTALAGLGWLVQNYWRDWRWRLRGRAGAKASVEPVRREAGRWLRRFSAAPQNEIVPDLMRLRYAARETWSPPAQVFAAARRAHRARGRR